MQWNTYKKIYPNAVAFLDELPRGVVYIFLPTTDEDWNELERQLIRWKKREPERNQIIQLQTKYDLPFRPNQSLHDLQIAINLKALKQKRDENWKSNNDNDNDNDNGFSPPSEDKNL